ncbi:MAG: methyltransferase family protein [Succiniclasticum sp.]|jgi:protein-S-isoprenylcysteine O-methyltransferase Ste14
MKHFFTEYRTRISQVVGIAFVLLYMFSGKLLAEQHLALSGFMFLCGCVLVGIGAIGRIWCAQYIAGYKNGVLVREGPYSVCRNPLYFFSFLGAIGVGLCTESLVLTLILVVLFGMEYPLVIDSEEEHLSRLFGAEYEKYRQEVPRFIPNFRLYHEPKDYVVKPKVFREAGGDVIWFIFAVGILECIEGIQEAGLLPALLQLY